ncbi:MAG: ATP-dependent sacrificial sulfur transferase LarE [Peptostreptococcaceae bacterium]|nr:ATP-dependent sacrificial sulfur transferase LarE [Peptostreptococcaceae bacterium]
MDMRLEDFFRENRKVALCFSGGVDSAYLFYAGRSFGAEVQPYYLKTEFQPAFELDDAKRLAGGLGVSLRILEMSVLENDLVAQNDSKRCYYCKNSGLGALYSLARAEGYDVVIDGTNADDDPSDRPGMRALGEIGILSPLRMAGLTKQMIRDRSKEAGLFTWDKPAYACLATRVPTGTRIDAPTLHKIERSEQALFELGFSDFRVRVLGGTARLQLREEQMPKALAMREQILERICFDEVLLDLRAR